MAERENERLEQKKHIQEYNLTIEKQEKQRKQEWDARE